MSFFARTTKTLTWIAVVTFCALLGLSTQATTPGEMQYLWDLLMKDTGPDSDGDGIPDSSDPDDDNDGLPDTFELNPPVGFPITMDPLDAYDGLADYDGDGASNGDEYQAAIALNPAGVPEDHITEFLTCSASTCTFDSAPSPNSITVPPADTVSDSVGAIASNFNVSAGGNVNYSIPLLTPTGTAGLQPNLSLSYNSGAGNGIVGLGWSMSGVSTITRCRQTEVQDSNATAVDFSANDRFCLDGQRLVLADPLDTYGANGVEYRTEIDSNRKIISYGTQGNGPSYFLVFNADGSVVEYGDTTDSKLIPGSQSSVLIWGRNEVRDAYSYHNSGSNRIEYTYINSSSTSDFRLEKIEYAFGSGSTANAVVDFTYETRPDTSDGYKADTSYTVDKRLSSIDVKNEGVTLRTYSLTYLDEVPVTSENTTSKLAAISECRGSVCLPDTEFTWSDEGIDFGFGSTATALSGFSNYIEHAASNVFDPMEVSSSITANVDGDGNRDLVWMEEDTGFYSFRVATSNGSTLSTGTYESDSYAEIYGWAVTDYNQDNYSDFLVVTAASGVEKLQLFLNKDQGGGVRGYDVTPIELISDLNYSIGTLNLETATFTDLNNDGLLDIVYNDKYRLLEEDSGTVNGPYHFGAETSFGVSAIDTIGQNIYQSTAFEALVDTTGYTYLGIGLDQARFGADFNGDGLADIVAPMVHEDCSGCHSIAGQVILVSDGAGGYSEFDFFIYGDDFSIVDLNRDGLPDILCGNGVFDYNNGAALTTGGTSPGITDRMLHSLLDINQDGYSDFIYKDDGSTAIKALYWEGNGFANPSTSAVTIATTTYTEKFGPAGSFFDINGDGLLDYINFSNGVYLGEDVSTSGNNTKAYNLITRITNGLGNEKSIEYSPLTDSNVYTRGDDAADLDWGEVVFDFISPSYVVSRVETAVPAYTGGSPSIDVNATSSLSYTYTGLKTQPAGRGALGFSKTEVTDDQTGLSTETTFLQEFPFTGLVAETKTFVPNNATALNETTFTYTKLANLNGANSAPYRPVITESVTTSQGADSVTASDQVTVSGALSTVTTDFENYDTYANVGKTTVTTTGDGTTYTTVTDNTYNNNASSWFIGQLTSTKVTTSKTGVANVVREASFTYDATTGLLATEVREPNNASFTLTTTYVRDSFGNRIRATESGSGVTSRYTEVTYDSDGRYIDEIENSLAQRILKVESRNAYGEPTMTSNLEGVVSYVGFGELGRPFFQGNDTGSSSETELRSCSSVTCPTGGSYREYNVAADGSAAYVYYDNLARPIRQEVQSFNGDLVKTDIYYDESGRVRFTSNPYLPSETVRWNETEYDILGRVIEVTDAANNISTTEYNRVTDGSFVGMEVLATNAESQTKTTTSNARGQAEKIVDDLGGILAYEYDARGNLTKLISKGTGSLNIATEIGYDLLGRRTSLDDPDQGVWDYEYNLFGEMTKQTDALNQSSEMTYDVLGRLLTRIDKESNGTTIEGNTTWTYLTSGNGIGQVDTVADSISAYTQVNDYDSLGRIQSTYTEIGATCATGCYEEYATYDEYGRPFQQIDATTHGTQYQYNSNGYLLKILEASNSTKSYYEVEALDAWGNVKQHKLGNGLTVLNTYQATTGLPDQILVTTPLMATIQDNTYTFDKVGMLTDRDRYVESTGNTLSETFHYDELNRLTQATATGLPTQTFAYDITGNMTSKSDVGSYSYGAGNAGPHAVTTAGSDTYTYDNVGNMLTGGGRTVTYNSFRKPTQLTKGGHTTSFEYGPGRARYKRVDDDGLQTKTTIYIGNVEFISHSSGVTETKRYIGDIAVVSEHSSSGSSEHYTHKDHLGSVDIITDENGLVVDEFSFDAFGKRRNLITFAALTQAEYSALNDLTTRGFTGHEMLDEVGAIHMNGRVYDPGLGRFMSADPIVSDLSNGQRLNRYSYVLNSPLSYTDPSGFDGIDFNGDTPTVYGPDYTGPRLPNVGGYVIYGDNYLAGLFGLGGLTTFTPGAWMDQDGPGEFLPNVTIDDLSQVETDSSDTNTEQQDNSDSNNSNNSNSGGGNSGAVDGADATDGTDSTGGGIVSLACPTCGGGYGPENSTGEGGDVDPGPSFEDILREALGNLSEDFVIPTPTQSIAQSDVVDAAPLPERVSSFSDYGAVLGTVGRTAAGFIPGGDVALCVIDGCSLAGAGLAVASIIPAVKIANKASGIASSAGRLLKKIFGGRSKPDFIVSSDGAIVHASPDAVRESLQGAGFNGRRITNPSGTETGTLHNVPGMRADIRVMDGGPHHSPRVSVTRQGSSQPVNPSNGANFGNVPRNEQRKRSHIFF